MTRTPKFAILICVLALVGIVDSAYALHLHYKPTADSFCNISGTFNCDIVNQSIYAEVMNVPVALVGILGYAVLVVLAIVKRQAASVLLFAGALSGLAFSLYLTYVEAYLLATYCILCLTSLGIILTISVLATIRLIGIRRVAEV